MLKNYYNDYQLEFFLSIIDDKIKELNEQIEMLKELRIDINSELISRGDD